MSKGNEPAYPVHSDQADPKEGLTKREYALIHIAAAIATDEEILRAENVVEWAREIVDALGFKEEGNID